MGDREVFMLSRGEGIIMLFLFLDPYFSCFFRLYIIKANIYTCLFVIYALTFSFAILGI